MKCPNHQNHADTGGHLCRRARIGFKLPAWVTRAGLVAILMMGVIAGTAPANAKTWWLKDVRCSTNNDELQKNAETSPLAEFCLGRNGVGDAQQHYLNAYKRGYKIAGFALAESALANEGIFAQQPAWGSNIAAALAYANVAKDELYEAGLLYGSVATAWGLLVNDARLASEGCMILRQASYTDTSPHIITRAALNAGGMACMDKKNWPEAQYILQHNASPRSEMLLKYGYYGNIPITFPVNCAVTGDVNSPENRFAAEVNRHIISLRTLADARKQEIILSVLPQLFQCHN